MIGASLIGSALTGKVLAIAAAAACAAVVLAGAGGYLRGHSVGVDDDKRRSDFVIANMVAQANTDLAAANETIRLQSASLRQQKEKAEHDLQIERSTNARRAADRRATDDLVREQIADFASGPGLAGDTLAACRDRAAAEGQVLDRVLRDLGACVESAEADGANARSVWGSWPRVPSGKAD